MNTSASANAMMIPKAPRSASIRAILLLLCALGLPFSAFAQQFTLSPPPYLSVTTAAGAVVPLGCVWTYLAGGTTLANTYQTTTGTLNANPIIAGSDGKFTAFLTPGVSYKFVYENVPCSAISHGATLKTVDGIGAIPPSGTNIDLTETAGQTIVAGAAVYLSDGSGSLQAGQWFNASASNTYSSTLPIIGVAVNACSAAGSCTVRIAGQVTNLSALTPGAIYYVASGAGTITSTAPANQRIVGQADTATSLVLAANPPPSNAVATIQTTTSTGTQNNFAVTMARRLVLYANNATAVTYTGLSAGANDGDQIQLVSIGAGSVTLSHQSGSSTAANRIITPNAVDMTVIAATLEYDATSATPRWRMLSAVPAPVVVYSTTIANVTTSTITTFCSFAVPSMAAGDWIDVTVPRLKKNNKGTDGNATFTFAYGGASTADAAVSWVDSATEYGDIDKFWLFRVGSDLWVWRGSPDVNPFSAVFASGTLRGNSKVVVSAPTFTSLQTVALKLTLAATDATFYYKPQSCTAMHYKAIQ